MKLSRWIPLTLLLSPLLAVADGPSTQPTDLGEPYRGHGYGSGYVRAFSSGQDWDEMIQFMQKNAPIRAHVIDESDAWDNLPARNALLKRWRDYRFVAEHFPEVADLRVKRFQIEDQIFGLELQVRRDPSVLDSIRPEIRLKAAELVDLSIEERQLRIAKLQNLLSQEQKRLADEQSQQDAEVNQRTQRIMERIERELPKETPAGPAGPATQPSTPVQ
jgi:hypothetical protein